MARLYKLTDRDGRTLGNTQWGDGISHSGTAHGELCGPGWIHAYEHPLIAVLMNPEHGGFDPDTMRLWEAEGEVGLREGQLKCGCKTLTTVREIPVPEITTEMWVRFAILCAKEVCRDAAWNKWADAWLSGEDRSEAAAAWAASEAAWVASEAAAARAGWRWARAWARAAWAASRAAWAASMAAWAASRASRAALEAVRASRAAWAASEAASEEEAARASSEVDLFAIAETACAG